MKEPDDQNNKVRFMLVDDHPISREGLGYLIKEDKHYTVAAEAGSAEEALSLLQSVIVDFVVVDISLRGINGIQLIRKIKSAHPSLYVLVVSMHDEALYAERALDAGADGYIMKEVASTKVLGAIKTVLSGSVYLSDAMRERILSEPRLKKDGKTVRRSEIEERLSDREFEIFALIGRGYGPSQIAEELSMSVKTVETHRNNLKMKFNLASAAELREYAIRWFKTNEA
jgi:DNA-binding NarL/FixJ family response regulator